MSKRFWVETKPSGQRQFVLQRSRSHGHHHHHHLFHDHHHHGHHDHHDHHEHHGHRREQWDSLLERARMLEETNLNLVSENRTLKTDLASVQADAGRLSSLVAQLQDRIAALCADNDSLRRSVDNAGAHSVRHFEEVEKLEHQVDKLEKEKREVKEENGDLRARLRSLSRQLDGSFNRRVDDLARELEHWKDQCRSWRSRHDDIRHRHDVIYTTLETRTEKMLAYEEILKRRCII